MVSVRVDQSLSRGEEFSDGLVTSWGSFQKIYTQTEFREYLQSTLDRKPYMASLGIAYIFKDSTIEAAHLARLSIPLFNRERIDLFKQFAVNPDAQALVELARALGRTPLASEFDLYPSLMSRFGSRARIDRLLAGVLNPDTLADIRRVKRDDLLIYFAMLALHAVRPPPVRLLPAETQADIKVFWPSYKSAILEGQQFLFQLGKPELIRAACQAAPIGKRLPSDLYLHRSAEGTLPALLRMLLFAAMQIVGEVDYNIVKLAIDGRKVSFLKYGRFDEEPHPALTYSVRVHLPSTSYAIRDYTSSDNPPILHRKDMFVDASYPAYAVFSELTRQEEAIGLLSRPDIGFRLTWLNLLAEHNLTTAGHTISSMPTLLSPCGDQA